MFVPVFSPVACSISKIQQFELPSFQSARHQNRNAVSLKKSLLLIFSSTTISSIRLCLCTRMLVFEWKERAFIEKVNSRCFCWFPAAILVHQNGAPIWRLHTKLYKGAWNVSANNSETVGHKDMRLSFSWLLPLDGFQFIFCVCVWQWKRSISWI